MALGLLGVALAVLLALNAFFVLAEFAIVKVRTTRVAQLAAAGDARAHLLVSIQSHLDEYLSVCQVGITLASIALGMVGETTAAVILGETQPNTARILAASGVSYIVVSGSHILLGELVPKSIAIRLSDRSALWCARPLRVFHVLFFPALWVLTKMANAILRLARIAPVAGGEQLTEDEIRIILERSQEKGLMSFRRLLLMENVFDFGTLTVRDAMRQRSHVRSLDARLSWKENLAVVRSSRFTRYPLLTEDGDRPRGFVHVKDLVIHIDDGAPDLSALARPLLVTTEGTPLETLFSEMQRRRIHIALVRDRNEYWTGFVTFEDVIEELLGTIRDEFDDEERVRLADVLAADGIQLDIEGDSAAEAVRLALARMPAGTLPLPADQLGNAIATRERLTGTYLGDGVALPHARIAGLERPLVLLLRSERGIPCEGTAERARLLFVLLTPAGQPRVHQRLQSIIATMLHESVFVKERLLTAATAGEMLDVVRTGEQATLD